LVFSGLKVTSFSGKTKGRKEKARPNGFIRADYERRAASQEWEAGSWKLEVGSWKLEAGSWKLEVGSWKLEVGRQKSGTKSHEPRQTI
jgi:hypothetical protein